MKLVNGYGRAMRQMKEDVNEIRNLEVLKKTHKRPKVGDVFLFKPTNKPFYFGRVIETSADASLGPIGNLLYLYNSCSEKKDSIPNLLRENLLIPPLITNKLPWSMGYFETVANRPLLETEKFQRHYFKSKNPYLNGKDYFYDEFSAEIPGSKVGSPLGKYGQIGIISISVDVSRALNIPIND